MKRLGRLAEAIELLKDGLRVRGAADEKFRRAIALWNLGYYTASINKDHMRPELVRSVIGNQSMSSQ